MNVIFKDALFSNQFKRVLGYTAYKGAEIGECLAAATSIKEGNYDSWYDKWVLLADHVKNVAQESKTNNHLVSAHQAYLRASNYYRASYFFLRSNISDARIKKSLVNSRECFSQSMILSNYHCQFIDIPFEDITLPAYLYSPSKTKELRPLIICVGGYDSCAQELYFTNIAAGLERGYNCLAFDGPGQGRTLIDNLSYMRPDWENVIKSVIDYVSTLPEIDLNSIGLIARDLGGYLALRAATKEKRISALVIDSGSADLGDQILSRIPLLVKKAYKNKQKTLLDGFFNAYFKLHKKQAFYFKSKMATHGITSIYDYISTLQKYTLKNNILDITCPTLICDSDSESESFVQSKQIFSTITCPKRYMRFTKSESAGSDCQILSPVLFNQKIFDWLDVTFKRW